MLAQLPGWQVQCARWRVEQVRVGVEVVGGYLKRDARQAGGGVQPWG